MGPIMVKFKLDTGASANVLPYSQYQLIQQAVGGAESIRQPLTPTKKVLTEIGSGKIRPKGTTTN